MRSRAAPPSAVTRNAKQVFTSKNRADELIELTFTPGGMGRRGHQGRPQPDPGASWIRFAPSCDGDMAELQTPTCAKGFAGFQRWTITTLIDHDRGCSAACVVVAQRLGH